ncbi:hypothetical protein F7P69_22280 [Cellulosimicrobium funkei]|nr:hypothetical protein [Cellulosimicrobium funkei]
MTMHPPPAPPSGRRLLPVSAVPEELAGRLPRVATAGPADLTDGTDLTVLDHVLWPADLLAADAELVDPRTEVRRMAQLRVLVGGARLDLTGPAAPGPADPGPAAPGPPRRFGAATGTEDARRYLDFREALLAARRDWPAAAVALAEVVGQDTDRALAEATTADTDYRREVFDVLAVSPYAPEIDWGPLRPAGRGLAILYNFAPFADTGSTVASKRLRDFARTMDVVSCSWVNHKKVDPTIGLLSRPYVESQRYLDMRPSWASWEAYEEFTREALDEIDYLAAQGADYDFLYSRANWAPSHYVATAYKLRHPEVEWLAEFSDPLSLDVEGNRRGDALDRKNPALARLVAPVEAAYGRIPDDHFSIFGLAEILPYALAETILFTNEHQMAAMLENIYSPALAARVQAHAEVSNHPTLPPVYYQARSVDYAVDPGKLNLAYFGEFYATRGITDLTVALKMLPAEVREHVHLHVFTNFVPVGGLAAKPPGFSTAQFNALVQRARDGVGAHGIEHQVTFNAALPYLEFLGVTAAFDYLIVNDAHSGPNHRVNPFLPSKWSDYAGSTTSAWALVEQGSILSSKPAEVKTPVGDPNAARDMLWSLVERKIGGRTDA